MSLSKERNDVTMTRLAKLAALAAVGTLSLTACGGGTTVTTTAATSAATSTSTAATLACPTGKLVGGGSTAQKLAMETLTSNYAAECGNKATIEYSGTGSGAGIKDFYNGQIDFAGSDSALKSEPNKDNVIETDKVEARCSAPGWNLPLVVSPVAFAYNLTGVDALTLTPAVIADIFNGRITAWNDTAIAALNSGVTLPDTKISPFFRSDESGTSENMQKYLAASAPTNWTAEPAKTWEGTAGEGKKGTQGVADGVKGVEGGFGYIEWKSATDSQLGIAAIDNGDGAVELNADSVGKSLLAAEAAGSGNDLAIKLKYTDLGAGAYPAVMVTYTIVCSTGLAADQTAVLQDFLTYVVDPDTQAGMVDLGYAPLPEELRAKVATAVAAIK